MTPGFKMDAIRFLVVDDDRAIREVVDGLLAISGARSVYKAQNVMTAIEIAADPVSKIDCIIADYSMDPTDGLEFLQETRRGHYSHIPTSMPFIMLTASGQSDVVRAALELDVSGYVVKPVTRDALMKAIERALTRRWAPKPTEDYAAVALPKR